MLCSTRSTDQCFRVTNAKVTAENTKQEAKDYLKQMQMGGHSEKPLWGGRRPGEEPPLHEVRCKKVRIAKPQPGLAGEADEEGEQTPDQNGHEEAKNTILYMIEQVMNKNGKGGKEAIMANPKQRDKILAMREKGREVREGAWAKFNTHLASIKSVKHPAWAEAELRYTRTEGPELKENDEVRDLLEGTISLTEPEKEVWEPQLAAAVMVRCNGQEG